ncbi:ribonuclease III [bacterium]|jgi:ribonuclease III|nr:ribonuclease III [bacterium]MBT6832293.1 ribonuclease III [bacterium]MBT6996038.1 ribonuclease III [bacterium]MBT7772309.1 ribonuclease III [bacterium]
MNELFADLGIKILSDQESIFREAFTHRSAVNEDSGLTHHNERLEFLGDAVLEMVATSFLYKKFDQRPEGELTDLRSALVCGEHLAQVSRRLNFGKHLILSHGEAKSGGAEKTYLLANLAESVIGAIFLTHGLTAASRFIHQHVLIDLDDILTSGAYRDAKSEFQELTQGTLGITPRYDVLEESGKDHEKTFVMGAYLEDKKVGEGEGGSKKEAQTEAAAAALRKKETWLTS